MLNIPDADTEFWEDVLAAVTKGVGGYRVEGEEGWSFWLNDPGFAPELGQTIRFYGRGIGCVVRGVSIAGRVAFYRSPAEQEAEDEKRRADFDKSRRLALLETKIPRVVTPGFEWTEDMAEVSGFGGGYERACRQMISQGCAWWSAHPDADPKFHGYKEVYGLCVEDNEDARTLSEAICAGDIGPSAAMHQAAVTHVFQWRRLGSWIAYQKFMRDTARERADETDRVA